jgi:hypothetical protein
MKVGRGLFGLMSKTYGKCTSRGRWPFLCAAALVALGLSITLSGCGDISLNQLLENEEPGEFRVSPTVAAVPAGSSITIQGNGGIKPYKFEKLSGAGTLHQESGVYDTAGPEVDAEIEVSDSYGRTDTSLITVFAPLKFYANAALVSQISIGDTETVVFDADGGFVSGKYAYWLDGVPVDPVEVDGSGVWTFDPPSVGTYEVEVSDDLENSKRVTVDVSLALMINPTVAQVQWGNTVSFRGINVAGTAVYTADVVGGSFAVTGDDAVYTAPPSPFTGTVTITLTDNPSGAWVTATLHVLDVDPGTLELLLSPSSVNLQHGDVQIFEVTGGIPPYYFWMEFDDQHGDLEKTAWNQATYTAPNANTVDWVWVRDDIGTTPTRAKTKVLGK